MNTDTYLQINVTDSELAEFSKPQQVASASLRLEQHIQQEILNPTLHQIQFH